MVSDPRHSLSFSPSLARIISVLVFHLSTAACFPLTRERYKQAVCAGVDRERRRLERRPINRHNEREARGRSLVARILFLVLGLRRSRLPADGISRRATVVSRRGELLLVNPLGKVLHFQYLQLDDRERGTLCLWWRLGFYDAASIEM